MELPPGSALELRGFLNRTISNKPQGARTYVEFSWLRAPDGEWYTEYHETATIGPETHESTHAVGTEGGSIYSIASQEVSGTQRSAATVSSKDSLVSTSPWAFVLWFAFEGGRSLKSDFVRQFPTPLLGPGRPSSYIYDLSISRPLDGNGMIEQAEWRFNEENTSYESISKLPYVPMPVAQEDADEVVKELAILKKEKWREVDCRYRLLQVGRIGLLSYPRHFEFAQLTWDKHAPRSNVMLTIVGEVTNALVITSRKEMLPAIKTAGLSVTDLRFAFKDGQHGSRGIRYKLPGRSWIKSTNEGLFEPFLKDPTYRRPIPKPRPEWQTLAARVALVSAVLVLPLFLFLRRRKRGTISAG